MHFILERAAADKGSPCGAFHVHQKASPRACPTVWREPGPHPRCFWNGLAPGAYPRLGETRAEHPFTDEYWGYYLEWTRPEREEAERFAHERRETELLKTLVI